MTQRITQRDLDSTPRFSVGTQFLPRGKHPNVCTIIDVHTTRNLAGDIVGQSYLCEHEFMGQKIKHTEVDTTVAMGMCRLTGKSSVVEALSVGA